MKFKAKLEILVSEGKITEKEYKHFLRRGIRFEKFDSCFPLLKKIFPRGIPVGASDIFIDSLSFPYQETSYVCAESSPNSPKSYLYKTNKSDGGITNLTGGTRSIGDNVFASLNRIILGSQAILISADNLVTNHDQVWDWNFFGKYLKDNYGDLYEELKGFAHKKLSSKTTHVILARKKETFQRLGFLEKYKKRKIKVFASEKVIIMTNTEGIQYASKVIKPDENIQYIAESDDYGVINITESLKYLRKNFGIKKILNDGGRKMSEGIQKLGMLGGERISYEPYPGHKFLPKKITKDMVLGKDGDGIDGSPIKNSIMAFSQNVCIEKNEKLALHMYPF